MRRIHAENGVGASALDGEILDRIIIVILHLNGFQTGSYVLAVPFQQDFS